MNERIKIALRTSELEEILEFVKKVNPIREDKIGSGIVEIECQNDSGIGFTLKASVTTEIEGYHGVFTRTITGVEKW